MIGDAVGRTGRQAIARLLPGLRRELHLDLVIANGENAAAGRGITPPVAEEMFRSGIDVITTGNHIWDQKEIIPYLDSQAPILRPLNFPPGVPGRGLLQEGTVTIINLQGRVFMANIDCPFRAGTVDVRVLPRGTAFVCDVGMTAARDSIIGDAVDDVLQRFLTAMPVRLQPAHGPAILNSVLIDVDDGTGKARHIERVDREADDQQS
jgi:calcineurin-like phosphoesterase